MIKLVALDIAGTTVEEGGAVYEALAEAVTAAGGSPTSADIEKWMGAGKREAIAGLLGASDGSAPDAGLVDATFGDFRARLDARYRRTPPEPMPGVVDALNLFRAADVRIALTTGFDRDVTHRLLATIGWDSAVVDAVICIEDVTAGRPAPYMIFRAMEATGTWNVRDVLVAGDTVRDLEAGTNAGAGLVVGVRTGHVSDGVLEASAHDHIVDSVADLPRLLAERTSAPPNL